MKYYLLHLKFSSELSREHKKVDLQSEKSEKMLTSKGLLVTVEKELIIKIQIQLHCIHYTEGYECFDGTFLLSLLFSKIFNWRPFLLNLPLPKEE